jgi:predicted acylesterase/phospholipase RssA
LQSFKKFFGTSIGAVIALLVCVNCTPIEIVHVFSQFKFHLDFKFSSQEIQIIEYAHILDTISSMVAKKTGARASECTFRALRKKRGKSLHCIAYNYSRDRLEIFSHKTTPDMSCIDAIKLSCALPYLFGRCIHNSELYFDGGLVSNFPIDIAIRHKARNILGIVLHTRSTHSVDDSFVAQFFHLIFTPINHRTEKLIKKYAGKHTIVKIDSYIPITKFQLSLDEIMNNFSEGYRACKSRLIPLLL